VGAVEERAPKVPEQSRDWWSHNINRWRAACGRSPIYERMRIDDSDVEDERNAPPKQGDWESLFDDIQQLRSVANRYAVISARRVADESGTPYVGATQSPISSRNDAQSTQQIDRAQSNAKADAHPTVAANAPLIAVFEARFVRCSTASYKSPFC
jgi:hypothetical protein